MTDLFAMYSSAMPESMKKQEEEIKKKKEEELKKSVAKAKKGTSKSKPSIPENEQKKVVLPVVVYYSREKLVLECHPDDMVWEEAKEEMLKLETTSQAVIDSEEEPPTDDVEDTQKELDVDEEESDVDEEKDHDDEEVNRSEPIGLGEFKSDIKLRIIVPSRLIEKGKISKEDVRALLHREFPELSKDRAIIDYDKDTSTIIPVVTTAASKG